MDDDNATIGEMTLVMNDEGACAKHPNVLLMNSAATCPYCDEEFHQQKSSLKEKRAELDRQLKELEEFGDYTFIDESKMENLGSDDMDRYNAMEKRHIKGDADDIIDHRTSLPRQQKTAATPATLLVPPPQSSRAFLYEAPALPPAPLPPSGGYTLDTLAAQMNRLQQMQDWMLAQRDRDVLQLRQKVDDQQQLLQEKEVQIALLKERLLQQEQRMQQELKLIKVAALSSGRGNRRQSSGAGGGGNKEIHIQELHVSVGANMTTAATGPDGQLDTEMIKQATAAATRAAIVSAEEMAEKDHDIPSNIQLQPTYQQQQQQRSAPPPPTSTAPLMSSNQPKSLNSNGSSPVLTAEPVLSNFESTDDYPVKPDIAWAPSTAAVPTAVAAAAAVRRDDDSSDEDVYKADDKQEITFSPADAHSVEEDYDEDEGNDAFDAMAPLAVPMPKHMLRKPPPPPPTASQGNANRKDPMSASGSSLLPLTRDMMEEEEYGDIDGSGEDKKRAAIPTRDQLNSDGRADVPRGMNATIPKGLEFDDNHPPTVPLQEEVTIGTLEQSYSHKYLSKYEDFDNKSVGNTIASSTFGEDRQKVTAQILLDPYGDRGKYSGVVLRSTGMPHGLGRMVYEDDGRTFEGDWRHGRWHGYGRATFANGDSYEGEYRFDQRHGRGMYCWADGRVYDGSFSEDKRHGKGIFKWPDGATYEGDFVQGQREGHGRYTFSDGGYYVGSWVDGRYEGFGECHWEDGRTYKGEWRAGMAHGQGVETYPDGRVRHDGQWQADEPIRSK